jgi:hypothetical protein
VDLVILISSHRADVLKDNYLKMMGLMDHKTSMEVKITKVWEALFNKISLHHREEEEPLYRMLIAKCKEMSKRLGWELWRTKITLKLVLLRES